MEFPIFTQSVRLGLRRKEAFIGAFSGYALMTVVVSAVWFGMQESGMFWADRGNAARTLYLTLMGFSWIFFPVQTALSCAGIIVLERERKTIRLIQVAPLRPSWLLLQKVLSPLAIMGLFFFGFLPILALLFLLGGVSPGEFVYQTTNLAVGTLTAGLVGVCISASAPTLAKARGKTIGMLILISSLAPAMPVVFQSLSSLFTVNTGFPSSPEARLALSQAFAWAAWVVRPLEWMSPYWMCFSYYRDQTQILAPFPDWPFLETCPAAISWLFHGLFQMLLFAAAVRGWKRTRDEAEHSAPLSSAVTPSGWVRWLKHGRAVHGMYPTGGWVFFSQQDRETFKKGLFTKLLLASIPVAAALVLFLILEKTPGVQPADAIGVIPTVMFAIALILGLGLPTSSMRKDRDRGSGVFILGAPLPARAVFFGKWIFFQVLSVTIILLGWGITLVWWLAARSPEWSRWSVQELVNPLVVCLSWVPLVSVFGLYVGTRSRRKAPTWYFVIPVLILCCGGSFIEVLRMLASSNALEGIGESLEFFFKYPLWFLLYVVGLYAAIRHPNLEPFSQERSPGWRIFWATLWAICMLLEMAGWIGTNWLIWSGDRSLKFSDLVFSSRMVGAPLVIAFLVWALVGLKNETWWRQKLVGAEA